MQLGVSMSANRAPTLAPGQLAWMNACGASRPRRQGVLRTRRRRLSVLGPPSPPGAVRAHAGAVAAGRRRAPAPPARRVEEDGAAVVGLAGVQVGGDGAGEVL